MSRRIVLVGDQFAEFARNTSVVTLTDFRKRIRSGLVTGRVIIGQGMSYQHIQELYEERGTNGDRLSFEARDKLALLAITHKHDVRNVLITHPRRLEKRVYVTELALNDESDRLSDHVTGVHVGGMVLLEAGRQAAIATGEIEYEVSSKAEPMGFVWSGCRVSFNRFTFPVPTMIRVTIVEDESSSSEKPKCTAKLIFEQASKPICEMEMDYELLPKRTLELIEVRAAKRVVESLCGPVATADVCVPQSLTADAGR